MSAMSQAPPPPAAPHERQAVSLFRRDIVKRALIDSLVKLDPRVQVRNPVMFVVEIGAVITTVTWLIQVFGGRPLGGGHEPAWYTFTISFWLWLTVVFANMAEAFAEGRGRAQADTLRAMRQETVAKLRDGTTKRASELAKGDVVVVEAGELIPGDGTVIEGIASVDESAITGESAPVIRESGGDRSAVTGGTRVLSDQIVVGISATSNEISVVSEIGVLANRPNGRSVATTIMKIKVSPASRMLSAISFGVLRRAAPSTSAIIRSRNEWPGSWVICTTIRSDSTRVPPVTALRSPPDSRITGAD